MEDREEAHIGIGGIERTEVLEEPTGGIGDLLHFLLLALRVLTDDGHVRIQAERRLRGIAVRPCVQLMAIRLELIVHLLGLTGQHVPQIVLTAHLDGKREIGLQGGKIFR